jgi:protoporphyrinogen oxidase
VETVILGAGALGLTLGMRLALQGEHITIIEREARPGGLAAGFPVGDITLEKFYHHIFRTDKALITLLNDIGLGDELVWGSPNTSSLVGGKAYRLDGALPVLRFSPLPLLKRVRMGAALAALKYTPTHRFFERTTADAWLRRWMGLLAYEVAWKPLLVGKFGAYAPNISLAWFWARLHCRTPQLGYLRGGFQRLYDRLAEIDTALDAQLHFETTATAIRQRRGGQLSVATTAGELYADRVISTLPTRVTLKLMPTVPTFMRKYDWGTALGAHCLIIALDRPLTDIYWLNINDPGYPFLALVEHTNFIPPSAYGGRHLVYLGNYLPMNHPLFKKSKEEVLEEFLPHLKRINPAFDASWVTESWMFAAPYAQPVVTPESPKHIPPHETPIPNLYLANMFQVYPEDRGQNYAIAMANRLAQRLVAGGGGKIEM